MQLGQFLTPLPGTLTWKGKSICIPLGYDTSQIDAFTQANDIRIQAPSEISNCFNMLDRGRVHAVWVSELVGAEAITATLGKDANVRQLDLNLVGPVHYFLIVSRKLPNAQAWVDRFDAGLQRIKSNGTYQRIVQRYKVVAPRVSPP